MKTQVILINALDNKLIIIMKQSLGLAVDSRFVAMVHTKFHGDYKSY